MPGLIEGKVAVITGAGSGVGRAATLLFTQHGAKVVAADVDAVAVAETVAQAVAGGGDARAQTCDVADEAAVVELIASAVAAYGRLDIVYNNAGITVPSIPGLGLKRLEQTTTEDWERVQSVNIRGVINGCKAAIVQFEAQGGGGVIVNTASVAGLVGYGGVAYGATKGAVVNLTRALALEVAARGIRVNSVCPGGMLTHYAGLDPEGANAETVRKGMDAAVPLGRAVDPTDTASGALFLASDLAAKITGVNLPIDAGLTAGVPMKR